MSISLYAQSRDDISIYLQQEPVEEGSRFNLYIEIPREYQPGLRIQRPQTPERMRYYSGPSYESSFSADIPEDRIRYRYNYVADVAGYVTVEPFTLIWPELRLETEEILVPVTADGSMVPPELEWSFPSGPIFEGQTVYISLDMHRAKEIIFPESLRVESARDGILEEVTGLGELTTYEFMNETFNRIPLATFLYTPLESGNLRIPAAQVSFSGYRRTVSSQVIQIQPLRDSPSIENGAVGRFELSVSSLPEELEEGDELVFELIISGEGSLGVLQMPEIEVRNGTIEGRDQIADYEATENGYSGSRRQIYRIRADSPGEMTVMVPDFQWFNPFLEGVQRSGTRIYRVNIQEKEITEKQPSFSQLRYPVRRGLAERFPLDLAMNWIGALLFALIPLILIFQRIIGKKRSAVSATGVLIYTLVSISIALIILVNAEPQAPVSRQLESYLENVEKVNEDDNLPVLLLKGQSLLGIRSRDTQLYFHVAQLEHLEGNNARAVMLMRKAVSLSPLDPFLRSALGTLQQELQLNRQFSINRIPHGDWSLLLVYLSILFSGIYLVQKDFQPRWNASFVVGAVLVIIVLALSTTMLFMYRSGVDSHIAVIKEGGVMLKKIPDKEAENWIFLPEGTTVSPGVSASGFIQIRTAYGIEAWVADQRAYLPLNLGASSGSDSPENAEQGEQEND
ncbi:BatD family protein [Salinispira pacifica]|uniref:BatD n=1 Tax=Salinispira pacifica TaxID=1307761 RepID=V5WM53_9SPIO|nr:BatD family protein [Salinispira pacifica]AHC16181.1 hypothetical protein L21SP2_2831 [Salinispira pacifica]